MEKNKFELTTVQLKGIAQDLEEKVLVGLKEDDKEILCLPTYINPKKNIQEGKVLVLDWGGTNFRAAIVQFSPGKEPAIIESLKKPLSAKETKGFSQDQLFEEMAKLICQLKELDGKTMHIGYCFSYPAESTLKGDAILLRWTKEIEIPEMIGKFVGKPLLDFLNEYDGIKGKVEFKTIKVINDTIACLFAGLAQDYNSYIGLIVGTGTNMATLIQKEKIQKLNPGYDGGELIPVNLESGNLIPSPGTDIVDGKYLTEVDKKVDSLSVNGGRQLFEKAISGGYLGEIFRHSFPHDEIEKNFDGERLTTIMGYPDVYKEKYVPVARWIYVRSAKLVAASLAGLIQVLLSHDKSIKSVCLTAEGSLFWSNDRKGKDYNKLVSEELNNLLPSGIRVVITKMDDANLIGSAIAALS